jgi:hypothetical protein
VLLARRTGEAIPAGWATGPHRSPRAASLLAELEAVGADVGVPLLLAE